MNEIEIRNINNNKKKNRREERETFYFFGLWYDVVIGAVGGWMETLKMLTFTTLPKKADDFLWLIIKET